jgi:hypothetical protein
MSVLSELINAIKAQNIECFEGDVEQILRDKPKYSRFAAVVEESAEVDQDGVDGLHHSQILYTLLVTTYVKMPSLDGAWQKARSMRDDIIDCIESQKFHEVDVMVNRWERSNRETESLDAGYTINLTYTRVHEP